MSSDTNKLNETEIICPSEFSLDENYIYNDSNEKSLKESRHAPINKSNILLNVLKDFSVKYDLDDKKIMKSKKFMLSFEDLISLVKFALEFQIKINNSLNLKDYLNEISQDFINNLSYYVFSYEKIDINQNNNVNINYNTYNNNLNNKKNKKQINIIQTPVNYKAEGKKVKNEELSVNNKNKSKNEFFQNNKSFFRTNNNNNKIVFQNKNNDKIKDKKKDEVNNKNRLNRCAERRRNNNITDFDKNYNNIIEDNNKKKKLNKSLEKRKNIKNENKMENKNRNSLSIFTACENLKGSNNKLRRFSCEELNSNKNYLNYNTTNKKNDRVVYYDQNLNIGVKKQIISNNIIRPSTMANKLLQRGIK